MQFKLPDRLKSTSQFSDTNEPSKHLENSDSSDQPKSPLAKLKTVNEHMSQQKNIFNPISAKVTTKRLEFGEQITLPFGNETLPNDESIKD